MISPQLKSFILLRWYAATGVLLTLFILFYTKIYPVWFPSFFLTIFFLLTNTLLLLFQKKNMALENIFLGTTLFDLFFLTILIFHHGGAHNPFSILFIALCSVAAMNLSKKSLVAVIFTTLLCLAFIYQMPQKTMTHSEHHHPEDSLYLFHLQGMWMANSIATIAVTVWIYRLRRQNEKIAEQHHLAEEALFHVERIESMGRMFAATAHQLNTPLATLQLGINELSDNKNPLTESERTQWLTDLQKAMEQIKTIFVTMKEKEISDDSQKTNFNNSLNLLIDHWAQPRNLSVVYESQISRLEISKNLFSEIFSVIETLLENAYEARKENENLKIMVSLHETQENLIIEIQDNGVGMSEVVIKQALEPLFTTKKNGTGLGLYITNRLALKLGGSVTIKSQPAQGTTIMLLFSKKYLS